MTKVVRNAFGRGGGSASQHKTAASNSELDPNHLADRVGGRDKVMFNAARSPWILNNHDAAIGLAQIVLDADFASGAHLTYTDGTFFRFNSKHWAKLSEAELGRIVLPHICHEGERRQRIPAQLRDVIAVLRHATASSASMEAAEVQPIINVLNGELWICDDGAVACRPHHPRSSQRHCSDVVFDPMATCPRFDRAVADMFAASSEPEALVAFCDELFGYLLQPVRRRPLILVAAGRGRDGKSSLAETLVRLLGRDQVTAMQVEDLTGSRFILGDLAESRLFLDPDMSAGALLPDGLLKKLSEGTTVTAERKFRDPVTFTMKAVPLLLTNNTPSLVDRSDGFRHRLLVLPFERQFKEAEVDYGLFPMIHKSELSGVLNRALAGLRRVIQRGWKFDPPEAVTRATEAWWAEATGVPLANSAAACSPVSKAKWKCSAVEPASAAPSRPGLIEARPETVEPGHDLDVRVAITEARKGSTVHVRVEAASVEVRVTKGT